MFWQGLSHYLYCLLFWWPQFSSCRSSALCDFATEIVRTRLINSDRRTAVAILPIGRRTAKLFLIAIALVGLSAGGIVAYSVGAVRRVYQ